jgi:hypothetical protein
MKRKITFFINFMQFLMSFAVVVVKLFDLFDSRFFSLLVLLNIAFKLEGSGLSSFWSMTKRVCYLFLIFRLSNFRLFVLIFLFLVRLRFVLLSHLIGGVLRLFVGVIELFAEQIFDFFSFILILLFYGLLSICIFICFYELLGGLFFYLIGLAANELFRTIYLRRERPDFEGLLINICLCFHCQLLI